MENSICLCAYEYEAEILLERGANLVNFSRPDLYTRALRTPQRADDFTSSNPYLYGIPILFPPNRISGASFMFEGREYRFPVNEPDTGCFIHGTIHQTSFECIKRMQNFAEFIYRATSLDPYLTFPHEFTMRVSYTLFEDGIHQCIAIRNDSRENMPIALGFHTTFSLPFVQNGQLRDIRLFLDADKEYIRNMRTYLPTGEVMDDFDIKEDLHHNGIIPSDHVISRHFSMGKSREMVLLDTKHGIRVTYSADSNYHYWMVYNGGNENYICVEPQTWLNNCPNSPFPRGEMGFSFLKPDEERVYTTRMSITRMTSHGG